jgi:hypothetical protein
MQFERASSKLNESFANGEAGRGVPLAAMVYLMTLPLATSCLYAQN